MKIDQDTSSKNISGDQTSKNEIEKNNFYKYPNILTDTIGVVINGLRENEDCSKQRKHLKKLVKKLQVKKDHFAKSLLRTLKSSLGDGYTPEVQEAWVFVFKMLLSNVTASASKAKDVNGEQDPERMLDLIKMLAFLFLTIIAAYVCLNTQANTFDEMVFSLLKASNEQITN